MDVTNFFLGYTSWHPGAPALYRASGKILRIESGGSHLAAPNASMLGGLAAIRQPIAKPAWLASMKRKMAEEEED